MSDHRPCVMGHTLPNRHLADPCPDQDCTGCLPVLAAVDLQVCGWHETKVREALRDLAGAWAELGDPRRSKSGSGVRGDDSVPLPLADTHVAARTAIRLCLHQWMRILADDYQITIPADTIRAMSHTLAVQAGRLLASPEHAEQLTKDLVGGWVDSAVSDELVWSPGVAGEAARLNDASARAAVRVPCPACGARVRLDPEADVICCPTADCDEWGTIEWWRQRLEVDDDEPRPLRDLPAWLLARHGIDTSLKALRHLRDRGQIVRLREHRDGCVPAWDPPPPAVDAEVDCLGCTHPSRYDPLQVALLLLDKRLARSAPAARSRAISARQTPGRACRVG